MKTIWKFEIPVADEVTVSMPRYAEILDVKAASPSLLNLWAIVDTTSAPAPRRLSIRGTGHPLGGVGKHIATTQAHPLVWHIFEAADR